jgi:glycine/D-amino acid oxidase-like deaminating enzyme
MGLSRYEEREGRAPSYWLERISPLRPRRAALAGPQEADVCIVGGGMTGLWTAYELRRADPALRVLVLEAENAGFGASGRNGGWVVGELAGSPEYWASRGGRVGVRALNGAIQDTVDEIGRIVEREGIDCDFVKGGSLHVAQTALELQRVRDRIAHDREWGIDSVLLSASETIDRIAVCRALGARFTSHCARIQPAALTRGLADLLERAGGVLYENTRVTRIAPGMVHTHAGLVRARFVVRATEGYTAGLAGMRRALLPLNSSMIITEPLDPAAWAQLGWKGMETMLDGRQRYVYLQRTADGRIAIGGRGVPYRFGSRTDREGPLPMGTVRELRSRLVELFGTALREVDIADGWHGVLGVSRTWRPAVGLDRRTGLAWAGGYVGDGVAAANLAGRTLRDLILGYDTELTAMPWVAQLPRPWEPEPLRFIGVRAVHALLRLADDQERRTGRTALAGRLANRVAGR